MDPSASEKIYPWHVIEAILVASDRQTTQDRSCHVVRLLGTNAWNAGFAGGHRNPKEGRNFTQAETVYGVFGSIWSVFSYPFRPSVLCLCLRRSGLVQTLRAASYLHPVTISSSISVLACPANQPVLSSLDAESLSSFPHEPPPEGR